MQKVWSRVYEYFIYNKNKTYYCDGHNDNIHQCHHLSSFECYYCVLSLQFIAVEYANWGFSILLQCVFLTLLFLPSSLLFTLILIFKSAWEVVKTLNFSSVWKKNHQFTVRQWNLDTNARLIEYLGLHVFTTVVRCAYQMLLFYIFEAGVFKLSVIELEIIAVDLMYFQNIDILK